MSPFWDWRVQVLKRVLDLLEVCLGVFRWKPKTTFTRALCILKKMGNMISWKLHLRVSFRWLRENFKTGLNEICFRPLSLEWFFLMRRTYWRVWTLILNVRRSPIPISRYYLFWLSLLIFMSLMPKRRLTKKVSSNVLYFRHRLQPSWILTLKNLKTKTIAFSLKNQGYKKPPNV